MCLCLQRPCARGVLCTLAEQDEGGEAVGSRGPQRAPQRAALSEARRATLRATAEELRGQAKAAPHAEHACRTQRYLADDDMPYVHEAAFERHEKLSSEIRDSLAPAAMEEGARSLLGEVSEAPAQARLDVAEKAMAAAAAQAA